MKEQESIIRRHQSNYFESEFLDKSEIPKDGEVELYMDKIKEIESFSNESKRFHMLLDHSTFLPLYLSENMVKETGYTLDYVKNQKLLFLYKTISLQQINLAAKIHIWGNKMHKLYGKDFSPKTLKTYTCGIKLRDKWGNWRTMIFSQKFLTFSKKNKPLLSYLEVEEISAFHKSNVAWYRFVLEKNGIKNTKIFFSNGVKKEADDLFSCRELEILKLSAKKLNNQEIADQLEITKNTVERHRKNMLAKTGVSNMTGLLRVSQIINII